MPFRTQGQQMVGACFEQPVRPPPEVFLMPLLPTQLSHLQLLRSLVLPCPLVQALCSFLTDSLTPSTCSCGEVGGKCLITVGSIDAKVHSKRHTLSWETLVSTTKWAYPENSSF